MIHCWRLLRIYCPKLVLSNLTTFGTCQRVIEELGIMLRSGLLANPLVGNLVIGLIYASLDLEKYGKCLNLISLRKLRPRPH